MKTIKYIIAALTGTLLVPALAFAITVPWNKVIPGVIYPPLVNDMVGIGTASPQDQLSVATSTAGKGITLTNSNTPFLTITTDGTNKFQAGVMSLDSNSYSTQAHLYDTLLRTTGSPLGGAGQMIFSNQNQAGFTFAMGSSGTDDSTGFYITPGLNGFPYLGIGLPNPGAMLSFGTSTAATKLAIWDDGSTAPIGFTGSSSALRINLGGSLLNRFEIQANQTNVASQSVFNVDAQGKVGSGTTTPSANFAIAGGVGSGPFSRTFVVSDVNNKEIFLIKSDGGVYANGVALAVGTGTPAVASATSSASYYMAGAAITASAAVAPTNNIFLGPNSGGFVTTANKNTCIGSQTCTNLNTGTDNSVFGYNAGLGIRAHSFNTYIGDSSGGGLASISISSGGDNNTGVGYAALGGISGGKYNTAIGYSAQSLNDTGSYNTSLGYGALNFNSSSKESTAVGALASYQSSNASTTALGYLAGAFNFTGLANTFIGWGADSSSHTNSRATAIGENAIVGCSNCMALGGTGVDAVNVGIGSTSPAQKLSVIGNASFANSTSGGVQQFEIRTDNSSTARTNPWLRTDGAGNLVENAGSGGNLYLAYDTASNTYINANGGNVGIGLASANNKLHVNGAVQIDGALVNTPSGNGMTLSTESAYGDIQTWSGKPLSLNPLGNKVGVGTSNPGYTFDVEAIAPNNGVTAIKVGDPAFSDGQVLIGSLKEPGGTYVEPMIWFGSNTSAPSFTNYTFNYDVGNGSVINSPVGKITQFRIDNGTQATIGGNGFAVGIAANTAPTYPFQVHTSASDLTVASNGKVGIGSTTPVANLSVQTGAQQNKTLPLFAIASTTNATLFRVNGDGSVAKGNGMFFAEAHIGAGDGTTNVQSYTAGSFTTVNINTVDTDNCGCFNTSTHIYTVQVAGTYQIDTKIRLTDSSVANVSYGQGADTSNADGPNFSWYGTTSASRQGSLNSRTSHFAVGDQIRMFMYSDGNQTVNNAQIAVKLLYAD